MYLKTYQKGILSKLLYNDFQIIIYIDTILIQFSSLYSFLNQQCIQNFYFQQNQLSFLYLLYRIIVLTGKFYEQNNYYPNKLIY
ncbi:unnamed protein product [Paramecium pentaurelia]|uniref:Transmembrane protein n=1 Tax=Paramecium pentaurelia TaxID=43138 RepID=A0A8S1XGA2_9CILI|nr:unnamed protein product [Paramecium pentaurelia]